MDKIETENYTLYCGDCLDILPISADAVISDVPYGMDWDTDSTRYSGAKNHPSAWTGREDWPQIEGDKEPFDPSPFLDFPAVILWGANHYANKLPTGTTLVWVKRAPILYGTFLSDAEIGWMKGGYGVYCFEKQFPPPSRIKEGNGKVLHPNQKPVELMTWCVQKAKVPAGGLVFDPYMGSGTTAVACAQMGLRFVGAEKVPEYFEIARKRIELAYMQKVMPF